MLRRLLGASLLLALVAMLPNLTVRAQNKMVPKDAAEKLTPGDYTGTLKTTPGSDRTFTLTIENKRLVATAKGMSGPTNYNVLGYPGLNTALNRLANAQRNYVKAAQAVGTSKNAKSKQQAVAKAQQSAVQLQAAAVYAQQLAVAAGIRNTRLLSGKSVPNFNVVMTKDDYDFQNKEEVKVRVLKLPDQFDEKGNAKKYTVKELNELKGKDKNLPGYESSLEKLETNQRVTVTLVTVSKKKLATAPANKGNDKEKDKDKDKDKDKEKDKDDDGEKKLQVKMIVILDEADAAKGKGKKGN